MANEKLEQAVKEIEGKLTKIGVVDKTINEKAVDFLLSEISNLNNTRFDVNQKYEYKTNNLNRMEQNLHNAVQIINGSKGFIKVPQGYDFIKSEFTCFPEILNTICMPLVEVFIKEKEDALAPGYSIYSIDERGMITFRISVADSSD